METENEISYGHIECGSSQDEVLQQVSHRKVNCLRVIYRWISCNEGFLYILVLINDRVDKACRIVETIESKVDYSRLIHKFYCRVV